MLACGLFLIALAVTHRLGMSHEVGDWPTKLELESAEQNHGLEHRIRCLERQGGSLYVQFVLENRQGQAIFRRNFTFVDVSFWDAQEKLLGGNVRVSCYLPDEFLHGPFPSVYEDAATMEIPEGAVFVTVGIAREGTRRIRIPETSSGVKRPFVRHGPVTLD
jgi:hypothetical protein